jgi:hypothetical protein
MSCPATSTELLRLSCRSIDPGLARRFWLVAMIVAIATIEGCTGMGGFRFRQSQDHLASVPRPRFSTDPQMEEVVDHLNRNVQKLHSWQAHNVKIRANNMPLSGTLAVEEGQHLRLVVNSIAGHEVDLGSNQDVFWIWAKRMEPAYVYCRHEQIDVARQALGVPFEPQWLMQALGVAPLETQGLTMQIDSTGKQARLVQPVVTAHGMPLQKVMQVDLTHGVITEHSIYDSHGQKIAQARLEDFRLDKSTGVILPRRVKLDWPQNQMSLVMNFGNIEVNPRAIPSQIWDMPEMPGVQMVDLGRGARPEVRIADRDSDPSIQLQEPEEVAGDDSGRVSLGWDEPEDDPQVETTFDRAKSVERVEYQTTPIERPGKRNWWDE